jgi:hypothetical protein
MHVFPRKIVALSLACCISGVAAMASVPPQVEQAKKILVAEKEQWAYVQKTLTDELQVAPNSTHKFDAWCKYHPVSSGFINSTAGVIAGIMVGGLFAYGTGGCDTPVIIVGALVAIAASTATAIIQGRLLEFPPATCLHALKSFIHKWPEHRDKVPYMLQNMFDDLYKQQLKSDITMQQAQKLVEGIMALSMVAQIA